MSKRSVKIGETVEGRPIVWDGRDCLRIGWWCNDPTGHCVIIGNVLDLRDAYCAADHHCNGSWTPSKELFNV